MFVQIQTQLGILTWPLLICAFLVSVILLERGFNLLYRLRQTTTVIDFCSNNVSNDANNQELAKLMQDQSSDLAKAIYLIAINAQQKKNIREDIANLWLIKQKQQLTAGLKFLQVIGIISPLLGLLGTVLGLIQMFAEIGLHQGPVTPAQLATGLGLAMNTTAAGLIIALPALTGSHLLMLWSERRLQRFSHVLNQINLWLDGISISQPHHKTANTGTAA